jgi:hypothetical protein
VLHNPNASGRGAVANFHIKRDTTAPRSQVDTAGIGDWIGEPFEYREILWLRVPNCDGNQTDAFVERVRKLGQVPLAVASEYVELRGYERLSVSNRQDPLQVSGDIVNTRRSGK